MPGSSAWGNRRACEVPNDGKSLGVQETQTHERKHWYAASSEAQTKAAVYEERPAPLRSWRCDFPDQNLCFRRVTQRHRELEGDTIVSFRRLECVYTHERDAERRPSWEFVDCVLSALKLHGCVCTFGPESVQTLKVTPLQWPRNPRRVTQSLWRCDEAASGTFWSVSNVFAWI